MVFQEPLIFRSKSVPDSYKFKILIPHKEYIYKDTIQHSNKTIFNAIYAPRHSIKGYIFYLHGTSDNVEYHTQFIPFFTDKGYQVWMMDYPGFGKSRGNRSEASIYEDAEQMFDTFAHQISIPSEDIIIVGNDLGTGIATHLALRKETKKLVLISPFTDLVSLFKDYVPWFPFNLFLNYKFPNEENLKEYRGKVGIFFGTNNLFIPYRNVRKLQTVLKPGDEYHEYGKSFSLKTMYNDSFQEDLLKFLEK